MNGARLNISPAGADIGAAPLGTQFAIEVVAPVAPNMSLSGFFPSPPAVNGRIAATALDALIALVTYSSDLSGYHHPLCGASSDRSTLDRRLGANLTEIRQALDRSSASVLERQYAH